MRRTWLLLPLILASCRPPAVVSHGEHAEVSEVEGGPRVVIRWAMADPVIKHELSLASVAHLPGAVSRTRMQGLTTIRQALSIRRHYSTEVGDGTMSAWLEGVGVTLSLTPVTIYLPKEYPQGGCEYEALLAHEREHVRIARAHTVAAAKKIEEVFARETSLPTKERPSLVADDIEAMRALKRDVDAIVDPIYAGYKKELEKDQGAIDEPSSYRTVFQRCSGWL